MFKKNKTDLTKTTYCPLAWTHSFVNQDGSYQVCCTSEEFDNHIKDDNGNKLYVQDDVSPQDVMNSKYMKDIRKQMLNNEWPEVCKRCQMGEEMGGVSRRTLEIKNYENKNESFLAKTLEDGETSAPIISADYRLGNLCNLQCRMCNPRSTQLWIREWNDMKHEHEKFSDEVIDSYRNYNWINSDALTNDFARKAAHLEHIHFAGGEPLIAPQMEQILKTCIESNNAKNIMITYNTNMTVLPPKIIELWKNFKGVKILASIDGIGAVNSYIRHPANWDKIHKNLCLIDEKHEEYNISECMISSTVQVLNVLRIKEIFTYLEQFEFIVPAPNMINLHFPFYFQTTILPKNHKLLATMELKGIQQKYANKLPAHYQYLLDNIEQIIKFMNSKDAWKSDLSREFFRFQSKFDQAKKIDLFEVLPEFKKIYESHT